MEPYVSCTWMALYPDALADKLTEMAKSIDKHARQLVEEQWRLRYQLWLQGMLDDKHLSEQSESEYFAPLKDFGVNFFQHSEPKKVEPSADG